MIYACDHIVGFWAEMHDGGGLISQPDISTGTRPLATGDEYFVFCPRCGAKIDWPVLERLAKAAENARRDRARGSGERDAADQLLAQLWAEQLRSSVETARIVDKMLADRGINLEDFRVRFLDPEDTK